MQGRGRGDAEPSHSAVGDASHSRAFAAQRRHVDEHHYPLRVRNGWLWHDCAYFLLFCLRTVSARLRWHRAAPSAALAQPCASAAQRAKRRSCAHGALALCAIAASPSAHSAPRAGERLLQAVHRPRQEAGILDPRWGGKGTPFWLTGREDSSESVEPNCATGTRN